MSKVNCQRSNVKSGFSIAEVVISASILIIMTAGIFLALGNSITHSADSRNLIIASELAQEGIELVRNVRDNNIASGKPSYAQYFDFANANNCRIDKNLNYGNGDLVCNSDMRLYIDANNFYTHDNIGSATKFFRRIKIADYAGGKKITSMVSWNGAELGALEADCNTGSKCVYANAILTAR